MRPGRSRDRGPRASARELFSLLFERRALMAGIIAIGVLAAAASLLQPLIASQAVRSVEAGETLGPLVWLLVAVVIAAGLLAGVQHYLLQRAGEGIVLTTRTRLIARVFGLPISEFDRRRTGDLVSRIGSDTTQLRAVLTQGLVEAMSGSVTFIGALVAMFVIDPVLLGLTALVLAAVLVIVSLLAMRVRVSSARAQEKVGELTSGVERGISAVRTIRASGATERETASVAHLAREAYDRGLDVARISALVVPLTNIALQGSFLMVIGVGGLRVAAGALTIAQLVAFILFLFLMIMPLGNTLGAIVAINQALGALGRIQEILRLPLETDGDRASGTASATGTPAAPAIAFDDVTFAYPSQTPEDAATVLRGVSFAAPRGARVALVGPSGAGKTTSLALIERFYDAGAGRVLINGTDVRDLPRAALRRMIGYVEQDAPVLAGTVRDNVTLGAPDASDAAVLEVLARVNLSHLVERSAEGLDAQVGEGGVMLSGGERQRLALARTLLAAPPIILLDESTSSLDGRNEQLMRDAIAEVAAGRTLLVIAHRLSTVVDSDEIVVLDEGRVVGRGTHDELVASVPLYADLARRQLLLPAEEDAA